MKIQTIMEWPRQPFKANNALQGLAYEGKYKKIKATQFI